MALAFQFKNLELADRGKNMFYLILCSTFCLLSHFCFISILLSRTVKVWPQGLYTCVGCYTVECWVVPLLCVCSAKAAQFCMSSKRTVMVIPENSAIPEHHRCSLLWLALVYLYHCRQLNCIRQNCLTWNTYLMMGH